MPQTCLRRYGQLNVCLYRNDRGLVVAKGINYSISSDLVIRATKPLVVQISKSLKEDEVPDDWRYFV
jgi:hypothetical protein